MRRMSGSLPAILVGALALGGCGGDDNGDPGADDTSAEDPGAAGSMPWTAESAPSVDLSGLPGEEELRPGLLTRGQMPFGFDVLPPNGETNDFCDAEFTEVLGFNLDDLPTAEVTYSFDPDLGPTLQEIVGFVPEGMGPEMMPAMREAFERCSGDEVNGLPTTISEMPFPTMGDDSAAFELELTNPETGQTLEAPMVYATRGDLMVGVLAYDYGGTDEAPGLVEDYVPKAIDKAASTLVDRLPTPTPLTRDWPPSEPGQGDLAYGLLTTEDAPAAWSSAWGAPDVGEFLGSCVQRIDAATRGMAQIDQANGRSDQGPLVYQMLGRVGDHGPELMAVVRDVMTECDGTLVSGRPLSVSEAPIADVGDGAQAYRVHLDGPENVDADIGVAYILTEDLVIRLYTLYADGDPVALLNEYAPIAVDQASEVPS